MFQKKSNLIVEILTIGREILDGRVIDTNSTFLGEKLSERGHCPRFAQRVDDNVLRILQAFETAEKRANFIVVTGGLGPTSDDLTAEAFAKFLNVKLALHTEALEMVSRAFDRMQRPFTEVQKKQALLPLGCTPLSNALGTAPGIRFSTATHTWFFVPGVPREMKSIFEESILPELPNSDSVYKYTWKTQFTSEGELQERIQKSVGTPPDGFELCYRTRLPENHVSLIGVIKNVDTKKRIKDYETKLCSLLDQDSYYSGSLIETPEIEDLVIEWAQKTKMSLAVVESCTGGLISHRLTNVPGSSEVLRTAYVTYDNEAKIDLGVSESVISNWGAVSPECSEKMAVAGLCKLQKMGFKKGFSLSTTGIAGPGGGSAEKPVGLCYITLAHAEGVIQEKVQARPGLTREDYKKYFSQKALSMALEYLKKL